MQKRATVKTQFVLETFIQGEQLVLLLHSHTDLKNRRIKQMTVM